MRKCDKHMRQINCQCVFSFTDMCLPETTGDHSSYGLFRWNYTLSAITQNINCTYGEASAHRKCGGNFSRNAFWEKLDISKCEYGSETTKELNALLEV